MLRETFDENIAVETPRHHVIERVHDRRQVFGEEGVGDFEKIIVVQHIQIFDNIDVPNRLVSARRNDAGR